MVENQMWFSSCKDTGDAGDIFISMIEEAFMDKQCNSDMEISAVCSNFGICHWLSSSWGESHKPSVILQIINTISGEWGTPLSHRSL